MGDSQTLANGNPSVPTWSSHPAWTAKIQGAAWMWSEYLVSNPTVDTTVTFTRTFNLPAAGSFQGSVAIAADNIYTCYLNGMFVGADLSGGNFRDEDQDKYSLGGKLQNGLNIFRCEVTNLGGANSTAYTNPAGLLYKISIEVFG